MANYGELFSKTLEDFAKSIVTEKAIREECKKDPEKYNRSIFDDYMTRKGLKEIQEEVLLNVPIDNSSVDYTCRESVFNYYNILQLFRSVLEESINTYPYFFDIPIALSKIYILQSEHCDIILKNIDSKFYEDDIKIEFEKNFNKKLKEELYKKEVTLMLGTYKVFAEFMKMICNYKRNIPAKLSRGEKANQHIFRYMLYYAKFLSRDIFVTSSDNYKKSNKLLKLLMKWEIVSHEINDLKRRNDKKIEEKEDRKKAKFIKIS